MSALLALSEEERERFAAFLEQEAASQDGLASQLAGLPAKEIGEQMAKKYRAEGLAMRVTAAWLRSWHKP